MNGPINPSTSAPHRSPSYPSIDLSMAIEKARIVFREVGRHTTGPEVIAKWWGYTPTSSTFRTTLGAVRAFGLLESVSNGTHRLEKLSTLALDIVADYAEGSSEWRKAVQTAALKPQIYSALWERYPGSLPAADELKRYLVKEKFFTDKAVADFIRQYKETVVLAQLGQVAKESDGASTTDNQNPAPVSSRPPDNLSARTLTFPLEGARAFELRYPANLTKDDVAFMAEVIKLCEPQLIASKE